MVARDKAEAKAKGKRQFASLHWDKPHTDNLHDVDDCIPLDCVAGRYVRLVEEKNAGVAYGSDCILLS